MTLQYRHQFFHPPLIGMVAQRSCLTGSRNHIGFLRMFYEVTDHLRSLFLGRISHDLLADLEQIVQVIFPISNK